MLTIYHNGECSKSRGALEMLQDEQIPHEVRWYLAEPLSEAELLALLKKLDIPATALIRKSEPFYLERFGTQELTEAAAVAVLLAYPQLMERPIVENASKAVVARPPERLREIL